jgi:hypothetical protein
LVGFFAGAGELLGPITISDIWFVHERGTALVMYNALLSVGATFGLFIGGFITDNLGWPYLYWIYGSMIGALTLLVIFNFPETTYNRPPLDHEVHLGDRRDINFSTQKTYTQRMALFSGIHTHESFLKLFIRPFLVIAYPAVLWATLAFAGTIGFLVAVTSNVALAYGVAYGFDASQVGLCFLGGVVGSFVGIIGGPLIDVYSGWAAKRNGGLREPEMRLPAIIPALFITPLGLALYGAGIAHKMHWIVPTIGVGCLNFGIVEGTNVAIVYAIDCYKPIANEVVTGILAYKSAVGFLLSFYTNEWIAGQGYQLAYGEMAGISAALFIGVVPLYFFGKDIRQSSLGWRATKYIKWDQDRDDVVVRHGELVRDE